MTDVHIPKIRNEATVLRDTVTAHAAVMQGIATHAEKHSAARLEALHKLEAERKLQSNEMG